MSTHIDYRRLGQVLSLFIVAVLLGGLLLPAAASAQTTRLTLDSVRSRIDAQQSKLQDDRDLTAEESLALQTELGAISSDLTTIADDLRGSARERAELIRLRIEGMRGQLAMNAGLYAGGVAILRDDLDGVSKIVVSLQQQLAVAKRNSTQTMDGVAPPRYVPTEKSGMLWAQPYDDQVAAGRQKSFESMDWFLTQARGEHYDAPALETLGNYLHNDLPLAVKGRVGQLHYKSGLLMHSLNIPDPRADVPGFAKAVDRMYELYMHGTDFTISLH